MIKINSIKKVIYHIESPRNNRHRKLRRPINMRTSRNQSWQIRGRSRPAILQSPFVSEINFKDISECENKQMHITSHDRLRSKNRESTNRRCTCEWSERDK